MSDISLSKELRDKILQACIDRNVEWKEIVIDDYSSNTEITRNVPMDLAYAYIANDSSFWKPVCEKGLKMYNDSAFHSDLWLAMGNDINGEEYNMDNPETMIFYQVMDEIRFSYKRVGDFDVLNDSKIHSFKGNIVFENATKITDKDILVLPNANLKYESLARKAGMVITQSGGPVSHLVIVGREEMFPVIIMDEAIKKLRPYRSVKVDFMNKTIEGTFE